MKLLITGDLVVSQPVTGQVMGDQLLGLIKSHDHAITNFEAPVEIAQYSKHPKKGPTIFQKNGYEHFVEDNGFDVCCLANNHIFDLSKEGLLQTIDELEQKGKKLLGAGATYEIAYAPLILTKDGVKVALINACEAQFGCLQFDDNKAGYAWCLNPQLLNTIAELKATGHRVIVLPHAGLEGFELPLPEWRQHYKQFIDAGADMVIASHPHIIQGREHYKAGVIYYSLGNFFFNSPNKPSYWYRSLALSIEVTSDACIVKEELLLEVDQLTTVEVVGSATTMLNELSKMFVPKHEKEYLDQVNKECTILWEQVYYRYYSLLHTEHGLSPIKRFIQKLIKPLVIRTYRSNDELMLVHNIRIETNRYVVQRALMNKYDTY